MSSALVVKNKFDGNDYRISVVPIHKRISIPNAFRRDPSPNESVRMMGEISPEPDIFENIIFEAAVFSKNRFLKPLFVVELDGLQRENTEEEFTRLIHDVVANEKIDNITNFHDELNNVFSKYGFIAVKWNIWSLFVFSKIKTIFIFKNPKN